MHVSLLQASEADKGELLCCGKPCHKALPKCPHVCQATCHQGPCLAASAEGCEEEVTVRCSCRRRKAKMSCHQVSPPFVAYPLPSVAYPLPSIACPLPSVAYPLPSIACPLLPVAYPLPSIACPLPPVACPLPSIAHLLPSAACLLPSVACPSSFDASAPEYLVLICSKNRICKIP